MAEAKTCTRCGVEKPLTDFNSGEAAARVIVECDESRDPTEAIYELRDTLALSHESAPPKAELLDPLGKHSFTQSQPPHESAPEGSE
jgi:hypothetical protein